METPPPAEPSPPHRPHPAARALRSVTQVAAMFALLALGLASFEVWRLFRGLNESIDFAGGAAYVAEPLVDLLVDRLNESGYAAPRLDPEDPLLAMQVIVVTEGMNERVARRVVEQLLYLAELDPEAPITLYLSTPGGWLDAAFAIVDTMRAIRPRVDVIATGGCYSAGTVVLAGATGRRMAAPSALMSVHVNDYLPAGPYDADERELERFRQLYRERTQIPSAWFDTPGDNQYYLDAEQAFELGLIDEVAAPVWPAAAERDAIEAPQSSPSA